MVNPKLNTNFVPKIEDVAYKYLGVEKSSFNSKIELSYDDRQATLPINLDLEQVSPESSEKSPSVESKSPALIVTDTDDHYHMHEDGEERIDDLESPAFEPLETSPNFKFKQEPNEKQDDDMDISDGDDDGPLQMNGSLLLTNEEVKSNLSSISGLTSNDSNNEYTNGLTQPENDENEIEIKLENVETIKSEPIDGSDIIVERETMHIENCVAPEIKFDTADKLPQSENIISDTSELLIDNINQDSVLSQVSSTSRLSIVTNNNTNTRMDDGDGDSNPMQVADDSHRITREQCPYGISEEAQMQKFNESSSSSNSLVIDTDNMSNGTNQLDKREELITSFDIKREEIKFEGTERKSFDLSLNDSNEDKLKSEQNDSSSDIFSMGTNHETNDQESETQKLLMKEIKSECKLEDVESTNSENLIINIKSEFNSKSTSNDEKPSTHEMDDSKYAAEDSNSLNNKGKESKSSSVHRNGNDSDSSKHRSKDRSHHTSSRHRSHSEKDKNRKLHSSSHSSSSSRDKSKSLVS